MSRLSKLIKHKNEVHNAKNFLLIGAPNVGKSTIFNRLTNSTSLVSNIDRMTTEHTVGKIKKTKELSYLIDLPGVYNLSHPIAEENETSYHLIHGQVDGIVNVISAFSIQRDLYLTLQCIETGLLNTLTINMVDLINPQSIDWYKLSKRLNGVNIVLARSNRSKNVKSITKSIEVNKKVGCNIVTYSSEIEQQIKKLEAILPELNVSKRFAALMILEKNEYFIDQLYKHHPEVSNNIKAFLKTIKDKDYLAKIRQTKNDFITLLLLQCGYHQDKYLKVNISKQQKFDHWFLKKWIGIPLFILIVLAIYYLTFGNYAGGWLQSHFADFLTQTVGGNWLTKLFNLMNAPAWCTSLFVNGIFNGIFIVLSFIIPITILYTCVTIIQQVGLLSRVSVLLDNTLAKFGLSGRSIVNLLTGFGCTVPALMLARSSSSKKERIISILITPFAACTTRVMVISFIANIMFAKWSWLAIYGFVFLSGLIALLLGLTFSKMLFRKEKSFFCVEMVNWNHIDFRIVVKNVGQQLVEFLKKTVLVIAIANLIFWTLLHLGPVQGVYIPDGSDKIEYSILCYIGKGLAYPMWPIFGEVNWKLTSSLIAGLPAKETIISTLQLVSNGNIASVFNAGGFGIAKALAFMSFVLFYIPCLPSIFTMRKQVNWKYVSINLTTGLIVAYTLGTLIYWISRGFIMLGQ